MAIHEECGVFGVMSTQKENVAGIVYYGLYALQHRGQESCGIVVNDDGLFRIHKDSGLVNDVFSSERLAKLGEGTMALGQVRYGTLKTKERVNAEPIVVNHIKGRMAIATNGRIINSEDLKRNLELQGNIFHTNSDAELISCVITRERISAPSIEEAINRAMDKLEGGYTFVVMSPQKIIAARDENGLHPICYGKRENGEYVIASETCALDSVGAAFIREIEPGEILVFSKEGIKSIKDHCAKKPEAMCVFEYIYTARPDSIINDCAVQKARKRAGAFLAKAHPVEADVVVGVPDSGLEAALGYAEESGIPYGIGLIKNKYIGRTFIAPGQNVREDKVRIKLNPVVNTVKGKRVVLVDDSIVRGTTSLKIVKMLREAGAAEVHVRIASAPLKYTCYYGVDVHTPEELISNSNSVEQVCKLIDADSLAFLSHEGMLAAGKRDDLCLACFNHKYPTKLYEE